MAQKEVGQLWIILDGSFTQSHWVTRVSMMAITSGNMVPNFRLVRLSQLHYILPVGSVADCIRVFVKKERDKFSIYGPPGHMIKNYPVAKVALGANKVPIALSSTPSPKGALSSSCTGRNHLYALISQKESKTLPDVVTGMFKLFSHDAHYLLDARSTLSYVTLFVAVYFGFSLYVILDPFSFSSLVGDSLLPEESIGVVWYLMVVKNYGRSILDLFELDMVYFNVLPRMD